MAPSITDPPKPHTIVAADSELTIQCHVKGRPKPQVKWYRGAQHLVGDRYTITETGNLVIQVSRENIHSVMAFMSFRYNCVIHYLSLTMKITEFYF